MTNRSGGKPTQRQQADAGIREMVSRSTAKRGTRYRIDVSGRRIQVWIDGKPIVDLVDDEMDKTIGGQTLDHGGVALIGGFDAMFWVKNFSAQPLALS